MDTRVAPPPAQTGVLRRADGAHPPMRRLYEAMLRIRMVEERIAQRYPEQEMRCPVHLCIGQEAIAVGVCARLSREDYVLSGHRSHGHYLAKGGDLKAMVAEIYGKATGCAGGHGGSMHLVDLSVGFLGATPIVASSIPIAVGTALGSVMRREPRVTAIFFGDAAPETGVFHESLNFAMLKRLPVVFICENNLYSVYSPMAVRQPSQRTIASLAAGHGMPSRRGDGNDVVEVFTLAQEALQRAREGGGPTLLEFATYRWREHCGPSYDNDLGYRSQQEVREWTSRCPIARCRQRLVGEGLLSRQDEEATLARLAEEIDVAFRFAKDSPVPAAERLLEHVYAP